MRLLDLTHTFDDNMPVYPGDPNSAALTNCKYRRAGIQ